MVLRAVALDAPLPKLRLLRGLVLLLFSHKCQELPNMTWQSSAKEKSLLGWGLKQLESSQEVQATCLTGKLWWSSQMGSRILPFFGGKAFRQASSSVAAKSTSRSPCWLKREERSVSSGVRLNEYWHISGHIKRYYRIYPNIIHDDLLDHQHDFTFGMKGCSDP